MQFQNLETGPGSSGLAAALDAVAGRPCFLCGSSPDGLLGRCVERYRRVQPIVVVARGAAGELAIVPVVWDGVGEIGCPVLDSVGLLRPAALDGGDVPLAAALQAAGGRLQVADNYVAAERNICPDLVAAAAIVAWDTAVVWPVVDADALGALFAPPRTLVAPGAPRYGRWPAPWVPWISLADQVPWSEPPFRQSVPNGSAAVSAAAFRAVGLPPLAPGAHPLAEALLLAAFLRSAPWGRGKRSIGGRLLPPAQAAITVVGLCAGSVFHPDAGGRWRRLFSPHPDGPYPHEIEQALGHARMADALTPEAMSGRTG